MRTYSHIKQQSEARAGHQVARRSVLWAMTTSCSSHSDSELKADHHVDVVTDPKSLMVLPANGTLTEYFRMLMSRSLCEWETK